MVPEEGGLHQLHICPTDGNWGRLVEAGGRLVGNSTLPPSWSPDSRKIVVTLRQESVAEIGVLENFLPAEKVAAK